MRRAVMRTRPMLGTSMTLADYLELQHVMVSSRRRGRGLVDIALARLGKQAETPLRVVEAEEAVTGQFLNEAALERVQRILERTLTPITDARGSKEYRLEVSKSLVEKFWWEHRS